MLTRLNINEKMYIELNYKANVAFGFLTAACKLGVKAEFFPQVWTIPEPAPIHRKAELALQLCSLHTKRVSFAVATRITEFPYTLLPHLPGKS